MNQWPSENQSDSPVSESRGTEAASPASGDGDTTNQNGNEWSSKPSVATADARPRRVTWLVALTIVIGLPTAVAGATYLQPSARSGNEVNESSLAELGTVDPSVALEAEDLSGPTWVRSSWADAMPGVTAFELSAGGDVKFANGRHRPMLGVSCGDGQTDVHVTTGGTALIDPQTSGHVVNLVFDDRNAARQQWVAAQDQRALFAGDGLAAVRQIASARRLSFGFTHYMSGPTTVVFDLRGARDVIGLMAEECGWSD